MVRPSGKSSLSPKLLHLNYIVSVAVDEGVDFYVWCLWNEGDLTGIAAKTLKYAGRGRESIATPILAAAIQRIPPGPGFQLAFAFLDLLFKRGPDGRIRTLAELSSTEKAYVDAFIQSDHYRFWMAPHYGLPKTKDLRRWGNVWSRL
jgi:hypothetical protein